MKMAMGLRVIGVQPLSESPGWPKCVDHINLRWVGGPNGFMPLRVGWIPKL